MYCTHYFILLFMDCKFSRGSTLHHESLLPSIILKLFSSMSQYSLNSDVQLLFSAVDSGDLILLTTLLGSTKHSINTLDKHGDSLLHIACGYGYLELVKYLYNNGAILSIKDKQADTPLYWSSRHGQLNVVEWLLLQSSVSINSKDKLGKLLYLCYLFHVHHLGPGNKILLFWQNWFLSCGVSEGVTDWRVLRQSSVTQFYIIALHLSDEYSSSVR